MSGHGFFFDVPELPKGMQTHMCITWDSRTGAAAVFMDGKKSVTKINRDTQEHAVRPGGKVILGQDPDVYLGDFEAKQSFVGDIQDVNMWDSVLPGSTIHDLFSRKTASRGNVLDWETADLKVTGNVRVITTEL